MALTLHYWNGRGLAEVPRQMLAIAGKFPGAGYTDVRATSDDIATYGAGADKVTAFDTIKDKLDCNLGRLPMLSVGDVCIGQSDAINMYVATECGMMGSSPVEAGQIMGLAASVKECSTAWRKVTAYGSEPTAEQEATWFDTPANDVKGVADRANYSNRHLRWYAGRLEGIVGKAGFAVGDKTSLVDVLIYNLFAETMTKEEAPADTPAWKCEPFSNGAKTAAVMKDHPNLQAICDKVKSNEGHQKWLSMRGLQKF